MEAKYMGKAALWYPCAVCGKSVCHTEGPHVFDDGTTLYCPRCGGATIVRFVSAQQANAAELLPPQKSE